ncbi:hypothetical protein [Kordia sp.]|nr:hypothetical protein [Kordia sp.]MCH2193843.1 hypothetical protein [Kordia sp.]
MKKQIKKLALSKKVVANFDGVNGVRPPASHDWTRCHDACTVILATSIF